MRGFGTGALASAAITGFALNSILCRLALGAGAIDPASFTTLRLASGAVALAALARALGGGRAGAGKEGPGSGVEAASAAGAAPARREDGGGGGRDWLAAAALFGYAICFSFAYISLDAGAGALILFAAVQTTMIGWGVARGERLSPREWLGVGLALLGLAVLTLPGLSAPDPAGGALMACAGIAWGIYSLRGRAARRPLLATAKNFLLTVPMTAAASLLLASRLHMTPRGVLLAAASGAVTSGIGYALWYAALPRLTATRAAVIQLATPVLTAVLAVLLLGESLTPSLLACGASILLGIALAVGSRGRRVIATPPTAATPPVARRDGTA